MDKARENGELRESLGSNRTMLEARGQKLNEMGDKVTPTHSLIATFIDHHRCSTP